MTRKEIESRGATLMTVSADTPEEAEKMRRERRIQPPIACDPGARVIDLYGVREAGSGISIPATFVVDSSGRIVYRHLGTSAKDRPSVEELLAVLDGM